jgi:hypothetical protein
MHDYRQNLRMSPAINHFVAETDTNPEAWFGTPRHVVSSTLLPAGNKR